jgi:serine protease AprX
VGLPGHHLRQLVNAKLRDNAVISGHYKHVDGTSFAAPIVASIAAQLLEANPALKPHEIKRILIDTARRLPHVPVDRQGWGVVDPEAAALLALERGGSTGQDVEERRQPTRRAPESPTS